MLLKYRKVYFFSIIMFYFIIEIKKILQLKIKEKKIKEKLKKNVTKM